MSFSFKSVLKTLFQRPLPIPRSSFKPLIIATALLWLAHFCARIQIYQSAHLSFGDAIAAGALRGWLSDFMFCLLPTAAAMLIMGITQRNAKWAWILAAVPIGIYELGNAIFYRFFEGQLEIWVVSYYWRDIILSNESVGALGVSLSIFFGFLFAAASFLVVAIPKKLKLIDPSEPDLFQPEMGGGSGSGLGRVAYFRSAGIFVGMFCVLFAVTTPSSRSAVENHVLRRWIDFLLFHPRWSEGDPVPSARLRDYRTAFPRERNDGSDKLYEDSPRPFWPLYTRFLPNSRKSVELREKLGLPKTGPINVLLIFLESVRGYELWHPELGPEVFPNIHGILENHGIAFTQAYTSASSAGMTVRGTFSTVCSMFPNFEMPSVFMAQWDLNIRCLPEILREHGYETLWLNTYDKNYHHTREFEELHGTNQMFDQEFFRAEGVEQKIGALGLADMPFLLKSWEKIQDIQFRTGKPIFANMLTISTHHPFTVIPEGKLTEEVLNKTKGNPEYQGYLSRLRYLDNAFKDFFETFKKSHLADNTLLITVADHGIKLMPTDKLTPIQRRELRFRVPLSLITKNMKHPQVIERPVHQIDIAPTVGRIADVDGRVTWLGRGLFNKTGSPWVSSLDGNISYRTPNRACYQFYVDSDSTCLEVSTIPPIDLNTKTVSEIIRGKRSPDPLYDQDLTRVPFERETTEFFSELVRETNLTLNYNWVAPPIDQRGVRRK